MNLRDEPDTMLRALVALVVHLGGTVTIPAGATPEAFSLTTGYTDEGLVIIVKSQPVPELILPAHKLT